MSFKFTPEELKSIEELRSKVDDDRALVMPVLWMVQRKQGFIGNDDVLYLQDTLGIRAIFFAGAIGYFAMFNEAKKGKYELKFCKTITCKLRGSDELIKFCENLLGIKMGETSSDGLFSLGESECLGYCEKAPCMLCGLEQHWELNEEALESLIQKIRQENASR
ncbi:NADH:quinone oxidoreductase I, chain E [Campylobacter iguaniorum]|uniref:NADH-quinone oxidoreductase subunit NuoE family protein n=1 Tax=Campylobacter iguaniorum TaxID=1244531 RepID=UPI0007C9064E|nr:NAD(P)H-dependent oxidoreductase subunit E [Campylobacter iguaniorum]ANE35219.1 NADH:quinone oxidoreductase I, chain E [Campylobacter iguaniorum]